MARPSATRNLINSLQWRKCRQNHSGKYCSLPLAIAQCFHPVPAGLGRRDAKPCTQMTCSIAEDLPTYLAGHLECFARLRPTTLPYSLRTLRKTTHLHLSPGHLSPWLRSGHWYFVPIVEISSKDPQEMTRLFSPAMSAER